MLKPKLFISHTKADRAFVEAELLGIIRALGFEPWFAEDDIAGSDEWKRSIVTALATSDWFLLVMSERAAASRWVKNEADWALEHSANGGTPTPEAFLRIIPLRLDDCNADEFHMALSHYQAIDFRSTAPADRRRATERLIAALVDKEYRAVVGIEALENPGTPRRNCLRGMWTGTSKQDVGPDGGAIEYPIQCDFRWKGRRIAGLFSFEYHAAARTVTERLPFTGGFMYDRFLKLDYYDAASGRIQFGALLLELDPAGERLSGIDVGFGYSTKQFAFARAELRKAPGP